MAPAVWQVRVLCLHFSTEGTYFKNKETRSLETFICICKTFLSGSQWFLSLWDMKLLSKSRNIVIR